MNSEVDRLRRKIDLLSTAILASVNERAAAASRISKHKREQGLPIRDRFREEQLLDRLTEANTGPLTDTAVRRVFQTLFDESVEMSTGGRDLDPIVGAGGGAPITVEVAGHRIGRADAVYVAGPCSVEDELQLERVASSLAAQGVRFLRGGCFKPRTSPYAFQGLGAEGLRLLEAAARRHGMASVSETTSPDNVELVARHVDILQVGSRNMSNFELLRAVGRSGKPVVLKRGFAATIEEWILAAEYVAASGSEAIILCERGIRTFAQETRNTLDLSAVPLALQRTRLPVMVDVSHAAGRRDILAPLTSAAFAVGASAVMIEVHPDPDAARSDAHQQIDPEAFARLRAEVGARLVRAGGILRTNSSTSHEPKELPDATQRSL